MPEDVHTTLHGLLCSLEGLQNSPDEAIYTNKSQLNLLKSLNSMLGSGDEITSTDADRVLKICLRYKLDMRCAPYVLSIISSLTNIDKASPFVPSVDFVPSALAVLDFLRIKCSEDKTNHLRILSFQVLMSHPLTALLNLVTDHSPVLIETFTLFASTPSPLDAKIDSFTLLQLLHLLPAHETSTFVKEGIPLWLSLAYPNLMQILVSIEDKEKTESCLLCVETLTKQLVQHDYFEYPEWQNFLGSVVDPKKFPVCIKSLLEKGKDTWHRMWILIIKLLKGYVTKNFASFGTPINSMLPVVETAFKRDSTQRVRAFLCWNELIENFSNETNANCIAKRVKLVIIPLKLNNAKTEDAAVAKFYTWWLLIRKFEPKLDKFTNEILIPFLHFLFGKEQVSKPTFWAGQLSNCMKTKCLEAFVEIVGHSDCDVQNRCTSSIEPLSGKVITAVMLADHWNDWVHALKMAVKVVAMNYTVAGKMNLQCIWKSFMLLMTELLDNSLRRDWFNDLINLLSKLVQECAVYKDLVDILIDDLALPLFRDKRVETLLNSRSEDHRPLHKIVRIIMDKTFDNYYKRFKPEDLMKMLEPLVSTLVGESVKTPAYMIWLLDELPATDSSLKLWTALVRLATESDLCLQVFNTLLRWPFKMVHAASDVKEAALAWYSLYNVVHVKLNKIGFDNEISKVLTKPVDDSRAANYFIMFALIGVLKHKPDEDKMAKLEALTYEINDYGDFELLLPSLIDTLALMIDKSSTKEYENLAQITINCVNNVLKLINDTEDVTKSNNTLISRETSFSEVRANVTSINKTVLTDTILKSMKNYLAKCKTESIKNEIRVIISTLENKDDKLSAESPKKVDVGPKEFASPKVQEIKRVKRKAASIVDTVVENGEEYLVVKSNWKFNPKNLTENQKEKFQRKRDIPALYQDLSQSQEEFKLTAWKTDSQDTSLSSSNSSKSATNNNASEILKNMPSTNVVPKIMENILDNANNTPQKNVNTSPVADKALNIDKVATPKGTKSPRMALKDRVFRNVRNLIEKSSPSPRIEAKDNLELIVLDNVLKNPIHKPDNKITGEKDDLNKIDNFCKSPVPKQIADDNLIVDKQENQTPEPADVSKNKVITAKQNTQNITVICSPVTTNPKKDVSNSAPPLLSTERPARMKRKPKKFDDSLLLAFKKSRHSNNDSQNDSQESNIVQTEVTVAQVHTLKDKNDDTDIDQAPKTVSMGVGGIKKVNEGKSQKVNDVDVIVLDDEIIMDCCVPKDKDDIESRVTEKAVATPTTPILEKHAEKSPEKPTTVDIPSDKYKASEGNEKQVTQIVLDNVNVELPMAKTPLNKTKEDNHPKSTVKRSKAQNDKCDKEMETMSMPLKLRKAKLQNDNCINDDLVTAAATNNTKDLNAEKSPANNSVVEIEIDKDNNKLEALSTPLSKTNKSKDENHHKSTKKVVVQKETNENVEQSMTASNKYKEVSPPKSAEKCKEIQVENNKNEDVAIQLASATSANKVKDVAPKSSVKKTARKSRIEKELMIDMVEGHPFLKAQSEKRLTRKKILEAENSSRRKSLAEKLNKSKLEATPKTSKKLKEKKISPTTNTIIVEDSQDRQSSSPKDAVIDEPPCSEDIIESSQDSTITTISVSSTKRKPKRLPFVTLEKIVIETTATQDLIQDSEMIDVPNEDTHEKTDIELPQNKTAEVDNNTTDLTGNMDTEPFDDRNASDDVIVLSETEPPPIVINSEPIIGPETQELADADTQPIDPKDFIEFEQFEADNIPSSNMKELMLLTAESVKEPTVEKEVADITQSLPEDTLANVDTNEVSSPFKDDNLRQRDFLNNTLEISPIKIQSPDREKKSPSPETSSDFVVIKLSSPVHSNGEPFEKHGSPEFFTEDKVSPDKRDASPPRPEATVTNTSPSSSLSLKKNRPQVRPGGRAAQMLDLLCVNSDLKVTKVSERTESEETKRASTSTPARRNLRILYNSVGDNSDLPEINMEDAENFLKLQRTLPTVTSSPSGPILKRKLIDITDEATVSSASKRKRVSFHDPPVSTTISVHKYIEPLSMVRSPQSSAKKRLERHTRSGIRSPKRLENAFNLDSVLSKTVESFIETTPTDNTQNISLDITPVVEIVKTSELNDTDPFYPDLINCKEPIDVIATELSSPVMRDLFIKELEGKVETVGDLAKMTELEINRLCIKAPKIKVAKKVLTDYASKTTAMEYVETVIEDAFSEPMTVSQISTRASEMQTDEIEVISTEVQTVVEPMILVSTQTESVVTEDASMQTDEPVRTTTEDIISSCLADRGDFLEKLSEKLDEESIKTIAEKLPPKSMFDLLMHKSDNSTIVLNKLLKFQSKGFPKDEKSSAELSFVRDVLYERYDSRDLILLCSQLLQKIHDVTDKPA